MVYEQYTLLNLDGDIIIPTTHKRHPPTQTHTDTVTHADTDTQTHILIQYQYYLFCDITLSFITY